MEVWIQRGIGYWSAKLRAAGVNLGECLQHLFTCHQLQDHLLDRSPPLSADYHLPPRLGHEKTFLGQNGVIC